jgi:hypothetical protein
VAAFKPRPAKAIVRSMRGYILLLHSYFSWTPMINANPTMRVLERPDVLDHRGSPLLVYEVICGRQLLQ